jgi:molybdopterin converting factor small subunit
MNKITKRSIIQGNDELALSFYLLTKNIGKNEKILSFSRLLWPILSIQGVLSTHIMLDGLNIFSKSDKFSNPPRQPLIGHILRNIENRTKIEELNKLIEILTYKDMEAEEIGEGEESEYHTLKINGLVNPTFLDTLISIIPLIEYKPIVDYTVLDHSITTEMALKISENYREIVNSMKGNAYRWKTQTELIEKEVGKWLIDLNVQLKDLETRYSSQINKASSTIDPTQMDYQAKLEQDKIDQWSVEEKKKLIESISTFFKTAERSLEEVIKKNKFFVSGDSLKSRVFEDVIPHFQNHFNYLKSEGQKFIDTIDILNQKFIELKEKANLIDEEVNIKINQFKDSLNLKLKDRDKLLTEFQSEKQEKISDLVILKENIENKFKKIKEVIESKQKICLEEAQELIKWSLNDNQSELFSRPIQWIYMPIYAMFIENEDNMEEYMEVVFPGYISNNPDNIYEFISDAVVNLKEVLSVKIEDNMAVRSNFEFSSENKNLLKDPSLQKRIQLGLSKLMEKSLINEIIERKIRENINLLQ